MKSLVIGILICLSGITVNAHNPLSSKYHLETSIDASLLTINLSQDGVNQVLINEYGRDYTEKLDQKEFKELIINYVKKNFTLTIDGKLIELGQGGIRLGSHQTDLKFIIKTVSKKINTIQVEIPAFKENGAHQTIFSYTINGKNDKVILCNKNDYKSKINFREHQASLLSPQMLAVVSTILALVVLIQLLFKRNKMKNSEIS